MSNLLTKEEKEEFKNFLGEETIRWFRHLKGLTGTVIPCLKLNMERKGMSAYPVHFREGMQIRNWLRENAEFTKTTSSIDLDDCYVEIIEYAIL